MHKLSVIVPVFERPALVNECLKSIINQTYQNFEVIVVDDGSSIPIKKMLDVNKLPKKIRIYRKNINKGVSSSRNFGVQMAKGRWIAFCDSDDLWHPQHLNELIKLTSQFPEAGIVTNSFSKDRQDLGKYLRKKNIIEFKYISKFTDPRFPKIWTSACMIKKSLFVECGGFNEKFSHGEDLALWLLASYKKSVAFSSFIGAYYRQSKKTLSKKAFINGDALTALIKNKKQLFVKHDFIYLKKIEQENFLTNAISSLECGRPDYAKRWLKKINPQFQVKLMLVKIASCLPKSFLNILFSLYRIC